MPPVSVTALRAAAIVGSGSLSFEMVRNLTERLSVMFCSRWVSTRIQPAAIDDVTRCRVGALDVPKSMGRIIEIGGADIQTRRPGARPGRDPLERFPGIQPGNGLIFARLVTRIAACTEALATEEASAAVLG